MVGLLAKVGTKPIEVTRIKWPGAPPGWVVVLIFLGVIAGAVVIYLLERGIASKRYRMGLAVLRILVLAIALIILFEPIKSTQRHEVRQGITILLLDNSQSMRFKDNYTTTSEQSKKMLEGLATALNMEFDQIRESPRYKLVLKAISKYRILQRLVRENRLRVYTFGSGKPRLIAEAEERQGKLKFLMTEGEKKEKKDIRAQLSDFLTATEPETRLLDAISSVLREMRGQKVAGIVVVSDGQNTSREVSVEEVTAAARRRNIPIYTVGIGAILRPKDIEIVALDAREVVLKGDQVAFSAKIKSQGYEGETVDLVLDFAGQKIQKSIKLRGKGVVQTETLMFRPQKAGDFRVTMSVPVKPDEQFKDNNSLTKRIRVVEDKIKVLYIEGYPRWEYRYLKNALIRDPTLKVWCILQEATDRFRQETSPGLEPLLQLPQDKDELLRNYHVIIFGDVNPNHLKYGLTNEQMKWIKEFVEKGGGFVMIAGEYYAPHKYVNTPIEELLPIIPESFLGGMIIRRAETANRTFHMRLTQAGRESLVMRLLEDPDENVELWEDRNKREEDSLPGLFWYCPVRKAKPIAEVWAVHPTERDSHGRPKPIIATCRYGKGTVIFVGVDETWRWRFGVGDLFFWRFWSQVIRYAAAQALLGKEKRFSLHTDRETYHVGKTVTLTAYILDERYEPSREPKQVATIQLPDGKKKEIILKLDPKNPGNYVATYKPKRLGVYSVWLGGTEVEPEEAPARAQFRVVIPSLEKRHPEINEKLLRKLASATDGQFLPLYEIEKVPRQIEAIQESIPTDVREEPLWDKWWILVLFTGLIAVEWVLRRMRRLL